MKRNQSLLHVAGAGALALLMTTSAFAAPAQRAPERRNETRDQRGGSYRDNERVNVTGKVTSFSRERDGYRVQLDRGRESYWIPSSRMSNRGNDLRVGISVVLGGIFRGGRIDVDAVSWPGDSRYRNDSVRGTVERVDRRDGILLLRDSSTGRTINVDMRDTRRSSRVDVSDLRRGDYIEVSGEWLRGGVFTAERIESVDSRRR
jgi:hypothetical protein